MSAAETVKALEERGVLSTFTPVHQQALALWQAWMDGLKIDDRVGVHTGATNYVIGRVVRLTTTLVVVEIRGWAQLQRFRRKDGVRVGDGSGMWSKKTRIVQLTEHVEGLIHRSRMLLELNRLIDDGRRDRFARVPDSALARVVELLKGGAV